MPKILLIEDRVERQKLFSEDTGFNFEEESYLDILDNRISLDGIELDQYTTIICHRSAFGESNSSVLDRLKDHCKKTQTQLVFFSGGISSTFYSHTTYEFLLLNSKAFYSENLELYLNEIMTNQTSNLRLMAYGINWKINLMLDTLAKVNMFISQNMHKERIKAQRLKTFSQLDNLKEIVDIKYPVPESGGAIFLEDVQQFSSRLTEKINQEILMHA